MLRQYAEVFTIICSHRCDQLCLTADPENTVEVDLPTCRVPDDMCATASGVNLAFNIGNPNNKSRNILRFMRVLIGNL